MVTFLTIKKSWFRLQSVFGVDRNWTPPETLPINVVHSQVNAIQDSLIKKK